MIEIAEESEIKDLQRQLDAIYDFLKVRPIAYPVPEGIRIILEKEKDQNRV